MTTSRILLDDYVSSRSEPAFRELVERYINLVHSTAFRLLDGNGPLAEDVAQTVFIDLARQAGNLAAGVMLGGWLHRRTCHVAASVRRSERRRKARERIAMELHSLQDNSETIVARIGPILDQAINHLGRDDRSAILLRFFEQRDFRSVGEALGIKEDAARMRVGRALDKLHKTLGRGGISLSAAGLGAALGVGAVSAAPAGLASGIAATALATAAPSAGVFLTVIKWIFMSKLKAGIISAVFVGAVATPLVLLYQSTARLQEENKRLRRQLEQAPQLAAENARLSNLLSQASTAGERHEEDSELLKLRGQIGVLKKQMAEAAQARSASVQHVQPAGARSQAEENDRELLKQQGIAKMGYAKNWMTAFFLYADKNQEQVPIDFQSAASFLPEAGRDETLLATNQFEILYQGSLYAISNPASAIVLRETQAFQGPSGGWLRTYGFADGHTEIHRTEDGNFEPWETQHLAFGGTKPAGL